jgi:hypothetical protein
MKKLTYLLLLVVAFATSGCFEMLEDVYVNKDGTGKYQLTMDMSSLFSDPFMGEIMKQSMKEEGGLETLEIDSLIPVASMQEGGLPSSITAKERQLLDRTEIRMRLSETESIGKLTISFPFTSMAELNDFQTAFAKLNEEGGEQGGMMGMMGTSSNPSGKSTWSMNGRAITRVVDQADAAAAMAGLDEETLNMMKMFMAESNFTTTYHLPGKVQSCNIKNAQVDDKQVVVKYGFLELLEDQPDTGGTIKFKKN